MHQTINLELLSFIIKNYKYFKMKSTDLAYFWYWFKSLCWKTLGDTISRWF